jgi:hypothetical protein
MNKRGNRAWDFAPAGVAVAAGTLAIGYVRLMDAEGDSPRAWFLGGLVVASVLAGYGAVRSAPRRAEAIAVSGVVLVSFGILAMFSIGLPILIAGVVAIAFALKTREGSVTP